MDIEFDSKSAYGDNDKNINTRISSYGDKVNTNFQGKKIPKENASHKCLSLIMLGSVIRVNKKFYTQILLEECEIEIKKTKMENVHVLVHLIMKLKITLMVSLIMNLIMNNLLMNLRIKTVF